TGSRETTQVWVTGTVVCQQPARACGSRGLNPLAGTATRVRERSQRREAAVTAVAAALWPPAPPGCPAVSLTLGRPARPRSPLSSPQKQPGQGLFRQLNRGERVAYGLSCHARLGQPPWPGWRE